MSGKKKKRQKLKKKLERAEKKRLKASKKQQASHPRESTSRPRTIDVSPCEVIEEVTASLVPYDENLLEKARTQWQFGDWKSLCELKRERIQHHPDRARLALLASAGQLQQGDLTLARQYARLAQDWGCNPKLISQVLISGVHNSLGRAAYLSGKEQRSLQHFESAVAIGSPASDQALLTQARTQTQQKLLKDSLTSYALGYQGEQTSIRIEGDSEQPSPMVSLIIPFYNAEQYLPALIDSIEQQTYRNFEAIFINDSSMDDGEELVKQACVRNPSFRLISLEENHGVSYARNRGMEAAKGEYLRFIDADDTIPSNSLEVLMKYCQGQDVVRGSVEVVSGESKRIDLATQEPMVGIHPYMLPPFLQRKMFYGLFAMVINNKLLQKNKLRFLAYKNNAEDTMFLVDLFFVSEQVTAISDVVYQYNKHEDSLSNPKKLSVGYFLNIFNHLHYLKNKAIKEGQVSIAYDNFDVVRRYYLEPAIIPMMKVGLNRNEYQEVISALLNLYKEYKIDCDEALKLYSVAR